MPSSTPRGGEAHHRRSLHKADPQGLRQLNTFEQRLAVTQQQVRNQAQLVAMESAKRGQATVFWETSLSAIEKLQRSGINPTGCIAPPYQHPFTQSSQSQEYAQAPNPSMTGQAEIWIASKNCALQGSGISSIEMKYGRFVP